MACKNEKQFEIAPANGKKKSAVGRSVASGMPFPRTESPSCYSPVPRAGAGYSSPKTKRGRGRGGVELFPIPYQADRPPNQTQKPPKNAHFPSGTHRNRPRKFARNAMAQSLTKKGKPGKTSQNQVALSNLPLPTNYPIYQPQKPLKNARNQSRSGRRGVFKKPPWALPSTSAHQRKPMKTGENKVKQTSSPPSPRIAPYPLFRHNIQT